MHRAPFQARRCPTGSALSAKRHEQTVPLLPKTPARPLRPLASEVTTVWVAPAREQGVVHHAPCDTPSFLWSPDAEFRVCPTGHPVVCRTLFWSDPRIVKRGL